MEINFYGPGILILSVHSVQDTLYLYDGVKSSNDKKRAKAYKIHIEEALCLQQPKQSS